MANYFVLKIRFYIDPARASFSFDDYKYSNKELLDEIYDKIGTYLTVFGFKANIGQAIQKNNLGPRELTISAVLDNDKYVAKKDAVITNLRNFTENVLKGLSTSKSGLPNPPKFERQILDTPEINTTQSEFNKGGLTLEYLIFDASTPPIPTAGTQSSPQNSETTDSELDSNPTDSSVPSDDPNAAANNTPNQPTSAEPSLTSPPPGEEQVQPETDEQDQGRDERTGQNPNANQQRPEDIEKTKSIRNIFPNQKKAREIQIELPPDENYQKEFVESLGNLPLVWYNMVQVEPDDIISFELSYVDNLPTVKVKFKDTIGAMKDKGMPLDDTKLTIFLNPRTKFLKSIHMDFKISDFSDDNDIYDITGVIDVKELYLRSFKSYSQKSSYKLYEQIAKDCGLGFNSNIDDTNDQMTWINTGNRLFEFINGCVEHSYKSDETYLAQYIDFYYNLNYVDLEKEMKRDIKKELGIGNTGLQEAIKKLEPELVSRNFLSNDLSMKQSNVYFESYTTINESTRLSLMKGYLTKIKYYDELTKNFLVFEVDAITSPSDENILLRGAPQDETFFRENYNLNYSGRLDMDNVHKNYYYAVIQNKINYTELSKIGLVLELTSPNYNLYKFQKIFVIISNQKATPSKSEFNGRLTGQWLIVDISFTYVGRKFRQKVELAKRDLEISPEELKKEAPPENKNAGQSEPTQSNGNDNPTDQETPEPEQPPTVGPTASQTTTTETPTSEIPPPPPEDPVEDNFPLTKDMWRSIYTGKINPKVIENYYLPMVAQLKKNNITTTEEIAKVLAFINIESKYLTFVQEDINWFNYYQNKQ
jgi:hypothetical protein